jgi:hypothetical protein
MFDIDLVKTVFKLLGFLRVDHDVRRLALVAARGLVHHDPAVRQRKTHALLAAVSRSDPIDAACPTTSVETLGLMYCIVS